MGAISRTRLWPLEQDMDGEHMRGRYNANVPINVFGPESFTSALKIDPSTKHVMIQFIRHGGSMESRKHLSKMKVILAKISASLFFMGLSLP